MTLLQRAAPSGATSTDTDPATTRTLRRVRALGAAAFAGVLAVVVSWMVVCVPVILAWIADSRSTVGLFQALGIGGDLWAMAHRGAIVVGDTTVVLAPLLLTAVPLLTCRYAVNQVVVDRPEVRGRSESISGWRSAWRALGGAEMTSFVAGYLVTGVVLSALTGLGQAGVKVPTVLPGLLLVPACAVAMALRREHKRQEQPTIDRALRWIELHTPVLVRRGLRPAAEALAGFGVVALLIVTAVLVTRAERIGSLYSALDAGPVGLAVLTVGQLAMLPNLLVWALGWTTGVDLLVGPVQVGWAQTTGADLPLVPVLAALPEPGAMPALTWLVVAVPVLTGAWIGYRSIKAASRLASWWAKAQIAISAAVMVSAVVLGLSWLAVGGLTPGLLGQIGTAPLPVAGALLGELLAGALVTLTVLHLTRRRL